MSDEDIAKQLGRTESSISNYRKKSGLVIGKAKWTDAERQIILDNPEMTSDELTWLLPNHQYNAIACMRYRLGLSTPRPTDETKKPPIEVDKPRAVLDWTKWRPSVIPVQFDDGLKQAVKLQSMLMALGVR